VDHNWTIISAVLSHSSGRDIHRFPRPKTDAGNQISTDLQTAHGYPMRTVLRQRVSYPPRRSSHAFVIFATTCSVKSAVVTPVHAIPAHGSPILNHTRRLFHVDNTSEQAQRSSEFRINKPDDLVEKILECGMGVREVTRAVLPSSIVEQKAALLLVFLRWRNSLRANASSVVAA
jgi:hypothetical protein